MQAPPPPPGQPSGPDWALIVGWVLIALAVLLDIGSAANRDLRAGEAVGYVIGSLLFPFVLILVGRAIWCALQPKQTAPVFDLAWLVFGTGVIALLIGLGNVG